MRAIAIRFLLLAAVCTVALWSPAVSLAWDLCPEQSCPFWRDVCERGGGSFNQTDMGICVKEDNNITVHWHGVCTYPDRDPWTMECVGI
jgi:hypothetical protein